MGQPNDGASLDIATIPTFAMRWLIPRLSRFQQKHPNITVHLAERMDPFVLAGSGFDAAIHFEHPAWTGMRTHPLLHEVLVPVCHPELLTGRKRQPTLEELPRLHRRQNPEAWLQYSQETGTPLSNPVAPWPEGKTISKTFCLVLPEPIGLSREPIQAFAQWLLDEAKT